MDVIAYSRNSLSEKIGSNNFQVEGETFHVNQVVAEESGGNAALSMAVGGAIGLIAGVTGIIAGGLIGNYLGAGSDKTEELRTKLFNGSKV